MPKHKAGTEPHGSDFEVTAQAMIQTKREAIARAKVRAIKPILLVTVKTARAKKGSALAGQSYLRMRMHASIWSKRNLD